MPGAITVTDRIRLRYGQSRAGQTYAAIAREYGVSRQLAHAALTRPHHRYHPHRPRRRDTPRGMTPFVVRFPEKQAWRCRQEAEREGKVLSVWLRDVLTWYLDGDGRATRRCTTPSQRSLQRCN